VRMHNQSTHENTSDNHEQLEPILLIAPPAVLAFLRDYSKLDPSITNAYVPLSNRLLDANDDCSEGGNLISTHVKCSLILSLNNTLI
jgi:hypothetical protein